MANQRVTDLDAIVTLPNSGIIHVIDTTVTTQNAAGSSFKITKANLLKENTAAILLNTAKVGITTGQATAITNNSNKIGYTDALVATAPTVVANTLKVGVTPTQASAITTNSSKVGYTDALVALAPTVVANTSKVGITTTQATAIIANTFKVGYTDALVASAPTVVANSAKVGISTVQSNAITVNTSKVGYTDALVAAAPSVVANTAKVGITTGQASAITASTSGLAAVLISISNNVNNACSKYVADFTNRVLVDVGLLESLNNVTTNLRTIYASTFFNKITVLFLPAGTKASKAYSLLPENGLGDSILVRNTTATRTNVLGNTVSVAANVPRLNYDTIGGTPYLLLEPQRTNRLLNSAVVADQSISTTAVAQTLSFTGTGTITIGGTFTGSLVGTGANNRVSLTFTPTAGTLTITVTGTCVLGQLTDGAFPTTYIPTTGSAFTRNKDLFNRNNLYTNNFITDAGGTFFVDLTNNFSFIRDGNSNGLSLSNATFTDGFFIIPNSSLSSRLTIRKRVSNSDTVIFTSTTDNLKIAITWNGATADIFANGVKVVSATAFTFTALELLNVDPLNVKYSIQDYFLSSVLTDSESLNITTL